MAALTPRSRKAKGRMYQQEIAKFLTECGFQGLKSTIMGEAGTDIQDPFGLLPWNYTECKRYEKSPSLSEIVSVMEKKTHGGLWCFFSRQSRKPTLAVVPLEVLQRMLSLFVRKGVLEERQL